MHAHHLRQGFLTTHARASCAYQCGDGRGSVYLDGRLHNRQELAEKLGISAASLSTANDAELLFAAYETWGEHCPEQLLGEFTFAVVDNVARRVFCVRDPIGIKPFFYYLDNEIFVFGSELHAVTAAKGVPGGLCDAAVAQYLRDGGLYSPRLTFYASVCKLPSATSIMVDADSMVERTYWRPADVPPLRLATEKDYVARLRELLEDAVRVRLDDNSRVGMHLSGGLDSSTIAALAAPITKSKGQTVNTFSWLQAPDAEEVTTPEWAKGQLLADTIGAQHHYTRFGVQEFSAILASHNIARHDTVDLWYERGVREQAGDLELNVLLSGWGGDQFITHYGRYRYLDTFLHGAVFATLLDMYRATDGQSWRPLRFVSRCFTELVQPLLPRWMTGRSKSYYERDFLAAASPEFRRYALQQPRAKSPTRVTSIRADQEAQFEHGHIQSRLESWAVAGQHQGIEYRYPLLDKRVVEFALGIPAELYRRRGVTRYLFRRAVQDLLPQEIWAANISQEPVRIHRLVETYRESLQQWRAQHGDTLQGGPYIDVARLLALIDKITSQPVSSDISQLLDIMTAVNSILVLNIDTQSTT